MKRLALASVLLCVGAQAWACSSPAPVAPVAALSGVGFGDGVVVRGRMKLPAPYALQQAVSPWVEADVQRVEVYLTPLVSGGTERHLGALPGPSFPIELRNLKHNTDYHLRLEAFDASTGGVQIDKGGTASVTLVEVGLEAEINGLSFALALADKTFSGQATGNTEVTPGVLLDPAATEALAPLPPVVPANFSNPVIFVYDGPPLDPSPAKVIFDAGNPGVAPYQSPYDICPSVFSFNSSTGLTEPAIWNGSLVQIPVWTYSSCAPPP